MESWKTKIGQDFFRDERDKWILCLDDNEIRMNSKEIHDIVKERLGIELQARTIVGLKARLRRILGVKALPFNCFFKNRYTKEEQRVRKAEKAVKLPPLPQKSFDLKNAGSEKKREYIFSYGIVRQMYRNYIENKDTLERYKEARLWFHEKYGE